MSEIIKFFETALFSKEIIDLKNNDEFSNYLKMRKVNINRLNIGKRLNRIKINWYLIVVTGLILCLVAILSNFTPNWHNFAATQYDNTNLSAYYDASIFSFWDYCFLLVVMAIPLSLFIFLYILKEEITTGRRK
jgi:hypothetical protein